MGRNKITGESAFIWSLSLLHFYTCFPFQSLPAGFTSGFTNHWHTEYVVIVLAFFVGLNLLFSYSSNHLNLLDFVDLFVVGWLGSTSFCC